MQQCIQPYVCVFAHWMSEAAHECTSCVNKEKCMGCVTEHIQLLGSYTAFCYQQSTAKHWLNLK